MTIEAPSQVAHIRRATSQDAEAVLPFAANCVAGSPFAGMVPLHEESTRAALLRCLVPGVGGAVVLVAEERTPIPDKPHEYAARIVGMVTGQMRTVWHSTTPVVEMLGGFSESEAVGVELRKAFRDWARRAQHATCAVIDGAVEKLS